MRGLIAVGLVVLLTGCATQAVWNKPDATQADFDRDKSACEYEALKYAGGYDPTMQTAIGQGIAMGMRRNEIATACMKQKGYSLERQSKASHKFVPVDITEDGKVTRIN